jgi:hypothetical protein
VTLDERDDLGVERDFAAARLYTLTERLNQSILGLLAVLVVLVRRPAPLNDSRHTVAISETCASQPHAPTEILAGDLAV